MNKSATVVAILAVFLLTTLVTVDSNLESGRGLH